MTWVVGYDFVSSNSAVMMTVKTCFLEHQMHVSSVLCLPKVASIKEMDSDVIDITDAFIYARGNSGIIVKKHSKTSKSNKLWKLQVREVSPQWQEPSASVFSQDEVRTKRGELAYSGAMMMT